MNLSSICRDEKGIATDVGSTSTSSVQDVSPLNVLQTGVSSIASGGGAASGTTTLRQNTVNPLNQVPYSQRYFTLYRKRITLPVFEYRSDFMRLLAENQCIVLVGEVCKYEIIIDEISDCDGIGIL